VLRDVIVIGGGAAGLFCARTAGLRGRRVLVLESNDRLGKKILISGGGRCNFTNTMVSAATYVTSGSPDFVRSALARFTPADFLDLVERSGVRWHEKKLGQLFCDHSSREIVRLLESECARGGVEIRTGCSTNEILRKAIRRQPGVVSGARDRGKVWEVATSLGVFRCDSLVIATGGLSYPGLGATPLGYHVARQFGVDLVPTRPGLVPLTWGGADRDFYQELSGISLECEVSVAGDLPSFRENLLFTHRGLSGPAILQISNYWRAGGKLFVNLLPNVSAIDLLLRRRAAGQQVRTALKGLLPDRFLEKWSAVNAPQRPLAQISHVELERMAKSLHAWELLPTGDEGYTRAEVTLGGVDTRALSSRTMESRSVPGLYFIGEVVDVTGWLGGYNFQWAWASGHAAGEVV
jgi:predicted Rossmann fold flavoprotein